MIKRLINPLSILSVLLFLGGFVFAPISSAQSQTLQWTGLFFQNNDFTGSNILVNYPNGLSINWGAGPPTDPNTGQPLLGIPADNFSARFSSNTTITGGLYEFVVVADGGVRLSVNGQNIINNLDNQGLRTFSAITNFADGAFLLVLDYVDYTGDALVQVTLSPSTGTPSAPTTQPQSAAVGEVVQVRGLSVRSGPFLGGTFLAVARPGASYPIVARNTQEGLFTWYLIQFNEEIQGWVSGRYFAVTQIDPNNLPIIDAGAYTTIYDPPGLVTGITRSNMNFRTFPTERAPRLEAVPQLDWGATVEILARTRQGGQDFWYQVRYRVPNTDTTYVGWIFAPFVDILNGSDPIDTVPTL
ncbi:MAG: PA14 domain-containing protein [Chloroflexota bacterium]